MELRIGQSSPKERIQKAIISEQIVVSEQSRLPRVLLSTLETCGVVSFCSAHSPTARLLIIRNGLESGVFILSFTECIVVKGIKRLQKTSEESGIINSDNSYSNHSANLPTETWH